MCAGQHAFVYVPLAGGRGANIIAARALEGVERIQLQETGTVDNPAPTVVLIYATVSVRVEHT